MTDQPIIPETSEPALAPTDHTGEQTGAEYLAGWQRARADYENLARRLIHEQQAAESRGVKRTVATLIPVFAHWQRAWDHLPPDLVGHEWIIGLQHIDREWQDVLTKLDINRITTQDEQFDPSRHEAVSERSEPDKPLGVILEEVEVGYQHHQQVIKAAKVIINKY